VGAGDDLKKKGNLGTQDGKRKIVLQDCWVIESIA
jgi:hypothetical protein